MELFDTALKIIDHYGVSIFLVVFFVIRLEKTLNLMTVTLCDIRNSMQTLTLRMDEVRERKDARHANLTN